MMVQIALTSGDSPACLHEVAPTIGVSISYLEMLSMGLLRGGLVRSFRGPGGGYKLAKPAAEISVLDIVLLSSDVTYNKKDKVSVSSRDPTVQNLWDKLGRYQYLLLQQISLADVVNDRLDDHPVLERLLKVLE
jgi:Rrf2 family iron-sulfur cluster assembly transcriptional regulator